VLYSALSLNQVRNICNLLNSTVIPEFASRYERLDASPLRCEIFKFPKADSPRHQPFVVRVALATTQINCVFGALGCPVWFSIGLRGMH
jgi:hypothetical protein